MPSKETNSFRRSGMLFNMARQRAGVRVQRRNAKIVACLLAVSATSLLYLSSGCQNKTLFEGYVPGSSPSVERQPTVQEGSHLKTAFQFEGLGGEVIPAQMALPTQGTGPWPLVVVLYGMGQTMKLFDTAADAVTSKGFALVVFEQYGWGARAHRGLGGISAKADVDERAHRTYLESRLLLDAVRHWNEINPQRCYLWGFSFGGMCAARVVADEPRYRACVISVCGGDFQDTFGDSQLSFPLSFAERLLWRVFKPTVQPLDPIGIIAEISPRPILFQSALHDGVIPESAALALQEAAHEPKTIRWYDTNHSRKLNGYEVLVFEDGAGWLMDQEAAR